MAGEIFCPICDAEMEVVVTAYQHVEFVDGKKHKIMCHCCSEVPKMWSYDNEKNEVILYSEMCPKRLCTADDLMEEGWSKSEARQSIKAVRALIKEAKAVKLKESSKKS